eukprot:COSAG01_NODE_5859_length_3987_cov_80.637088_2_plen_237_part_00
MSERRGGPLDILGSVAQSKAFERSLVRRHISHRPSRRPGSTATAPAPLLLRPVLLRLLHGWLAMQHNPAPTRHYLADGDLPPPLRADGRGWLPSRGAAGARHDTYHMELDLCDPHQDDLTPNLAAPRCQRAGRKWWVLAALTRVAVPCVGAGNRQVQGERRASAAMRQPGATAGPSSAGRVEASTPIEGMSTLAASSVKARRLAELRQQLQQERAQNDRLEAELESYKRQIADQGL